MNFKRFYTNKWIKITLYNGSKSYNIRITSMWNNLMLKLTNITTNANSIRSKTKQ